LIVAEIFVVDCCYTPSFNTQAVTSPDVILLIRLD